MRHELITLDRANTALLKASTALEAKRVSDIAKGLEVIALRQKDDEVMKYARSVHADALRLEGEFLATNKAIGARAGKNAVANGNRVATLKDQGISKKESTQAQAVAEAANRHPTLFSDFKAGRIPLQGILRKKKRREQERAIKRAQSEPKVTPIGPFDLVLADPPWKYEHCESPSREIENHYPTGHYMTLIPHIKEIDCGADCILLLWATAPKLAEAIALMEKWGFYYRTCAVWDKEVIGMGYWWRIQHELLLLGVRGKPRATPECERISSVFREARTTHSKKPESVYQWIEAAFPSLKKIEMYCRKPREGWAFWGNEC